LLELARRQVEVSVLEKRLEHSKAMPELNFGFFSQTMLGTQEVNGQPREFGTGDRLNGIQAGIAIPLWYKPFAARSKAAVLRIKISEVEAENFRKSLVAGYLSLLDQYQLKAANLDYYEKQALPQAGLIIEQATRSFNAGAFDFHEYASNISDAWEIRMAYLETLNRYNQTVVSLEEIMGKIL
jgi:cobalt-zinc-cadmium resistance protein CzcA